MWCDTATLMSQIPMREMLEITCLRLPEHIEQFRNVEAIL